MSRKNPYYVTHKNPRIERRYYFVSYVFNCGLFLKGSFLLQHMLLKKTKLKSFVIQAYVCRNVPLACIRNTYIINNIKINKYASLEYGMQKSNL